MIGSVLASWCEYETDGLQGTGDNFYKQKQLLPENLEKAAKDAGVGGLEVRYHDVSLHPSLRRPPATLFKWH